MKRPDSGALARIMVRGRFSVTQTDGTDLTPRRRKERGLLALLALSPDHRRSRVWLKDKLWSDRAPEQAATSLRRALCDLRKTLGPLADGLASDRYDVWLTRTFAVESPESVGDDLVLLEGLDVPDPEFDDWLRDLRQADAPRPAPTRVAPGVPAIHNTGGSDATLVSIVPLTESSDSEEVFLTSFLTDTLSTRLMAEGNVEVHIGRDPPSPRIAAAGAFLRIELSTVVAGGHWHVHLRAFADRSRMFLWSGRLELPMDFRVIYQGSDVAAFVSAALAGIASRFESYRLAHRSAYITLQRAARRLFTARREDLDLAETELSQLAGGEGAGVALAWQAFARLTRALEFGETATGLIVETRDIADEALVLIPDNPLALALAAQVEIKLSQDIDRGRHLAEASVKACDQNPYGLHALSQARLFEGAFAEAHHLAIRARQTAEGLPHAYCWDMQLCLTSLGVEDLPGAEAAARAAHAGNRHYRPALRYLTALNRIAGQQATSERYAAELVLREPGFKLSDLGRPDYPAQTLHRTGYLRDLALPPTAA
ncbi:AfsR/SARP family transcriptional regulator [Jannaschia pohangensis]|uniref:AfsR/SARP family transcriptional regulator n=1 Tax=Jannaschia pohangensis TaxID=390807 RepID=UPI001113E30A|nr:hypothetical protein [Jannaschia pohangensis]